MEERCFFLGKIEGLRSSYKKIEKCDFNGNAFKKFVSENSIERCQELLEGRFIIIIVEPYDTCYIFSDHFGRRDVYYQEVNGQTFSLQI